MKYTKKVILTAIKKQLGLLFSQDTLLMPEFNLHDQGLTVITGQIATSLSLTLRPRV